MACKMKINSKDRSYIYKYKLIVNQIIIGKKAEMYIQ